MVADKFGAWWRSAYLFGFDSLGKYFSYQPTCGMNPVYGDYCFDCNTAKDGDSVTILVHGYKVPYSPQVTNLQFYSMSTRTS